MKTQTKAGVGMLTLLALLAFSSIAEARLIKTFTFEGRNYEWMSPPRKTIAIGYDESQYPFPQTWKNLFRQGFGRYQAKNPGLKLRAFPGGTPDLKAYMLGEIARKSSAGSGALASVKFLDTDPATNQGNRHSPDVFIMTVRSKPFERSWWTKSGPVPSSHYDLASVFSHEWGHVLGVNHPNAKEANQHCRVAIQFRSTMCRQLIPGTRFMRTPIQFDFGEVRESLKRPAFKEPPNCAPGAPCDLKPGRTIAEKAPSQFILWREPSKQTWTKEADQVFVGKVLAVSEPFSSSKVSTATTDDVLKLMRFSGLDYINYKVQVLKPYRGTRKGQQITITSLYDHEFELNKGDERLFFAASERSMEVVDENARSRMQKITEFVLSPTASVFRPVGGNARTATKFKNRYRSFSEKELLNLEAIAPVGE